MPDGRYLIVNADDFGLSTGTNRGIIEAHEKGIVTSASLMVRQSGAAEAAEYGRARRGFSIGLHLDFGEWAFEAGEWRRVYEVVANDDIEAVTAEVTRQLDTFRQMMGREPTHLDSHQHFHRSEPAQSVTLRVARALNLPLRHYSPEIRFCGDFYGQGKEGIAFPEGISVENIVEMLATLPPGTTELGCHPGLDHELASSYCAERSREVETLCDPRVRRALDAFGIQLCRFGEWPLGAR